MWAVILNAYKKFPITSAVPSVGAGVWRSRGDPAEKAHRAIRLESPALNAGLLWVLCISLGPLNAGFLGVLQPLGLLQVSQQKPLENATQNRYEQWDEGS